MEGFNANTAKNAASKSAANEVDAAAVNSGG
jgi:hypothetical protein